MECGACGHVQDHGRFCGRCGARTEEPSRTDDRPAVVAPAGDLDASADIDLGAPPQQPSSPRQRSWRIVAGSILSGAIVGAYVAGIVPGREPAPAATPPSQVTTPRDTRASMPQAMPSPTSAVKNEMRVAEVTEGLWPVGFRDETDTVLVFDDGDEGIMAVDLDTGDAAGIWLPSKRAGDQPFRLWGVGGRLVYGRDQISVATLAPGTAEAGHHLSDATFFLPAADPGRLWLIAHASGRTDAPYSATLVELSGVVMHETQRRLAPEAVRGVPGGLAVRRDDGTLGRYDVETQQIVDYLTLDPATVADATADLIAWCGDPCVTLALSDAAGNTVATFAGPDVRTFDPEAVWISPDGTRVATAVRVNENGHTSDELRVYQSSTGSPLAIAALPTGRVRGDWSVDGRQFFLTVSPHRTPGQTLRSCWHAGTSAARSSSWTSHHI